MWSQIKASQEVFVPRNRNAKQNPIYVCIGYSLTRMSDVQDVLVNFLTAITDEPPFLLLFSATRLLEGYLNTFLVGMYGPG